MCCIIHRRKDSKEISKINLEKILKINSDGWGVSYLGKTGVLRVVKSLNMDEAIPYLRKLEKDNVEFLFHARYATHGMKIYENCHPYDLYNGVLFHNGTINIPCPNKKFSDTYFFSLKVSKALRRGRSVDHIVKNFKAMIGESRLAFMNNKGEVRKFGEWHEIEGHSYSKKNWWYHYHPDESSWSMCAGFGGNHSNRRNEKKRKLGGFWPDTSKFQKEEEDTFKEVMTTALFDDTLFTHQLDKLNEPQLNTIARTFPKLCAKYLIGRLIAPF